MGPKLQVVKHKEGSAAAPPSHRHVPTAAAAVAVAAAAEASSTGSTPETAPKPKMTHAPPKALQRELSTIPSMTTSKTGVRQEPGNAVIQRGVNATKFATDVPPSTEVAPPQERGGSRAALTAGFEEDVPRETSAENAFPSRPPSPWAGAKLSLTSSPGLAWS